MAYITKAEVKAKSEKLKALNKEYGIKATFSGSNSSTLKLTISKGSIDFIENFLEVLSNNPNKNLNFSRNFDEFSENLKKSKYIHVNHYYMQEHFDSVALEYLQKAYQIMLEGHWDESDIQTDYFSCSWYNNINIGAWNKPYVFVA